MRKLWYLAVLGVLACSTDAAIAQTSRAASNKPALASGAPPAVVSIEAPDPDGRTAALRASGAAIASAETMVAQGGLAAGTTPAAPVASIALLALQAPSKLIDDRAQTAVDAATIAAPEPDGRTAALGASGAASAETMAAQSGLAAGSTPAPLRRAPERRGAVWLA